MSCLAIIRSVRNEMSANEKKLADFILDNAPLVRDYSSQQIAASVGVSQSSVVKFSQKLGYKGFTALKLAIHESVVKQESKVSVLHGERRSKNDEYSLKDELYQAKSEAITAASDLNSDAAIAAAAQAIEASHRLQIVGSGLASTIARDMAAKLNRQGKTVLLESDAEMQILCLGGLVRGDCLLIISASGQALHLRELAKTAKKAGVVVIAITNQVANPVAAMADVRLYSLAGSNDVNAPEIAVATSQQHVVDLVYYSIVPHGGQRARSSAKARGAAKASK